MFLKALGAFGGLAALQGCLPGSSSGGAGATSGSITYLAASNFLGSSWNPYDNLLLTNMRAQRMVYDYLMWIDNDGSFVPGLATSLEAISPTVWEAKLRQGVKFHDGQPFTAQDVKASIELASNPKSATSSLFPGQLQVEVVDDYTARIHTPAPFAALKGACLSCNQSGAVISHLDAEKGPDFLKQKMNGTGAFKMVSYQGEAQGLKLVANADYWRGKPKINDVTIKYINDTTARMAAFQSGAGDIIEGLGPAEAQLLSSVNGVNVQRTVSTDSIMIDFRTQTPPMDNVKLRQAIAYAIDVPSIVSKIYGGYAVANTFFGQPNTLGALDDPNYYKFDPAKAKSLLADAGYPGGKNLPALAFLSVLGAYPNTNEYSQFIVQNLKDVGINVNLQMMDETAWADALFKPVGDMILHGWLVPTPDRNAWYTSLFRTKGLINFGSDPNVDAAIKAQSEALDTATRTKIIETQLEPALVNYAPGFPMFTYDLITGVSNKVKGLLVPHWYEFDMFPVSKTS